MRRTATLDKGKFRARRLAAIAYGVCIAGLSTIALTDSASAASKGYELPLALAMEAAAVAVTTCEANDYRVTATIVDTAGVIKVQAKGDGSAIHTKDSSWGKAYTIASMGRVFNLDTTGAFAAMLNKAQANNPALAAIPNIPGILPLTGGVAVRAHGKIVAGIGVGGAPGGEKDEVCALAALKKISDRLPR